MHRRALRLPARAAHKGHARTTKKPLANASRLFAAYLTGLLNPIPVFCGDSGIVARNAGMSREARSPRDKVDFPQTTLSRKEHAMSDFSKLMSSREIGPEEKAFALFEKVLETQPHFVMGSVKEGFDTGESIAEFILDFHDALLKRLKKTVHSES
jgi:hypothetical protein